MFLYNIISVTAQLNSEYNLQSYSAARLAKQLLLFVFQSCLRSLGRKPVSCSCDVIGWSPTCFLYHSDLYRCRLIKSIVMLFSSRRFILAKRGVILIVRCNCKSWFDGEVDGFTLQSILSMRSSKTQDNFVRHASAFVVDLDWTILTITVRSPYARRSLNIELDFCSDIIILQYGDAFI